MQPLKPIPVKPARILVVEDEPLVMRDLQLQVQELGYEFVGHAATGEFAIRLAGELRPDLVLMDAQLMGTMDGITAAEAIRTQFGLPVIFLTTSAEEDTLAGAKLIEPFGYILKPFLKRDLRVGIEMALYKHQSDAKLRLIEARFCAIAEAEKMEFAGRLVGGIAHDFSNLLRVILINSENAMPRIDISQPLYAELGEIRQAAQSSIDLTQQLMAYARKQSIEPKAMELNQAVTSLLKMLRWLTGEDIRLAWQAEAKLWLIKMNPSQFDQILINLFVNARDSIGGVGEIAIAMDNCVIDGEFCAKHQGAAPGEYVRLVVRDNGRGMEKETLAHIFEPFFTSKEVGKGTGLGLATVLGIVRQNLGFLTVSSEPGKGTAFSIYLPRLVVEGDRGERPQKSGPDEASQRGSETILLVEDDPAILKVATRILEARGYTVLGVETPAEAMSLAKEHFKEIHLLLTDVIMPEMNGLNLANMLTSLRPNLKRMFMSGYAIDIITDRGLLDEEVCFIQKPFTGDELATKVRKVLDSGRP